MQVAQLTVAKHGVRSHMGGTPMHYVSTLSFVLAVLAPFSSLAAPISDGSARKVIEDFLNNDAEHIPLGSFEVGDQGINLGNARANLNFYHRAKAADALGWVTIKHLPKPTGAYGIPLAPPHVFFERITVQQTGKGAEINTWKRPTNWVASWEWFTVKRGTFVIQRIVRNEEMKRGADEFRVVSATYSAKWNDDYLELNGRAQKIKNLFEGLCAACAGGPHHGTKRKARILLKYDDFRATWSVVAADTANEDDEFTTDGVNSFLKAQ